MKYIVSFFVTIFGYSMIPLTALAQGGFVPCGGGRDDPCQMCHFIQMGNSIMMWFVVVLIVLGVFVLAFAGLKLITSGGNTQAKDQAKDMFVNVIVGYLLVLSAWLIVDTLMKVLTNDNIGGLGPWNEMICVTQPSVRLGRDADLALFESIGPFQVRDADGQFRDVEGATTVGGGSCDVITDPNNPCHPDNLRGTCFGSRAEEASQVCNQESGGNNNLVSGTDRCRDGRSFSAGLWQVNILAHGNEIGCDTSSFTTSGGGPQGSCARRTTNSQGVSYCAAWNCEFRDSSAYEQCMSRAMDPNINNQQACRLYGSRGFDPWRITANHCGVAI